MTIEEISKIAQSCFQAAPTIVLGSGASMPHGLPSMNELATFLKNNIAPEGEDQIAAWADVVKALDGGNHLEAALEGKTLPEALLTRIVRGTWQCVNEQDAKLFVSGPVAQQAFPFGLLLDRLFQSTNVAIHVITTNYDRVVEYACNSAGLLFSTGFTPGYLQKWEATKGVQYARDGKAVRTVRIWKVHGSLDWFQAEDERVVGLPTFSLPDAPYIPLIVTPGLNKYEKALQDPFRTTIGGADAALRGSSAFLCIGFGFRDQHIHPKIIERCREKNVPIVVLARSLTSEAKSFLREKAGQNYLGIEAAGAGSRIYSSMAPDGIDLPDQEIWSVTGFLGLVT
jgi:SIR2-like domain